MSTIKSSAENLTLNADGSGNDIIFQSNGSNVATLDQAGLLTATSFAGSGAALTGVGGDISFGGDTFGADKTIGANDAYALSLETSGNVAMKIDSAGQITMPLQPSFNCTAAFTNLAVGSENEIALTERYDIGSNLASNTFTAPITGKYLITYMLNFDELHEAHTQFVIGIKTSNYEYSHTQTPKQDLDTTGYIIGFSASQVCDMDASDTMTFVIDITLGGAQTDIVATSTVSGHLLA